MKNNVPILPNSILQRAYLTSDQIDHIIHVGKGEIYMTLDELPMISVSVKHTGITFMMAHSSNTLSQAKSVLCITPFG
jgi:hypothetical protein